MRIGVDLGGTKIEAVALAEDGSERFRGRVPTPRDEYDGTIEAIADLVAAADRELGTIGTVGVGTPGALSPATGRIKNSNSTWLIDRPLDVDLERRLGRPVRMANDANCFALSEAVDGAAAGADVVFGVILGTGVGGGLVVSGRVIHGANAISGEWGHVLLPDLRDDERPENPCYCGRVGCVEQFLSGPALESAYRRAGGDALRVPQILGRAEAGEAAARHVLDRYELQLARGLGVIINVVDPDVIVLGGGLSNVERLYDRVPALWGSFVFSDRVDTRLVRNRHGDSSGVRGAAWLWPARVR